MAKVTCRYCGKKINKDTAYAVKHGRSYWYYCNLKHSLLKTPKDIFYEEVRSVIVTTHTLFYKEMDEVSKFYSYEKMTEYIKENKSMLNHYMSKDFDSEYAKVRYFASILKNNLADFIPRKDEFKVDIEYVENTYDTSNFKVKNEKGMDDLLYDLLE